MPDMDAARGAPLRARERGGTRMPIVAMTASRGRARPCWRLALDDYLSKNPSIWDCFIQTNRVADARTAAGVAAGVRAATGQTQRPAPRARVDMSSMVGR